MSYRTKSQDAQEPHGVEEVKLEPMDLPLGHYKPDFCDDIELVENWMNRSARSTTLIKHLAA